MYQIAILDSIGGKGTVLRSTVESRLRDLKLDPGGDVEFLGPLELDRLRTDSVRVGVLFSDDSSGQGFAAQVQTPLDSPAVVIPAGLSLENLDSKVPAAL